MCSTDETRTKRVFPVIWTYEKLAFEEKTVLSYDQMVNWSDLASPEDRRGVPTTLWLYWERRTNYCTLREHFA